MRMMPILQRHSKPKMRALLCFIAREAGNQHPSDYRCSGRKFGPFETNRRRQNFERSAVGNTQTNHLNDLMFKPLPTMKPAITSLLSLSAILLLTQCAAPRAAAPGQASTTPASRSAAVAKTAAPGGDVTIATYGDTRVATRRLINRPLTNKDIGKVYEEVTFATPSGTKSEERIIVRVSPKLQTKVVSR